MSKTRSAIRYIVLIAGLITLAHGAWGQGSGDALERSFQNPPPSARPRVWWHWMNGNITKEGIRLDLEWMHRVGIGGFQNFDASLNTPKVVQKRLGYMTPEWKDAFRYAATLADQLGLEMAIAGSPGWSESGGPWVPPAQAMKKVVWSETRVEGGRSLTGVLAKPPSTTGPFQDIPSGGFGFGRTAPAPPPQYYADSAVIAFREPAGEIPMAELQPKVTSSGGDIDAAMLTDGDLVKSVALPAAPAGQPAWIHFEFARPEMVYALTLVEQGGRGRFGGFRGGGESGRELQASDDGQQFRTVASIPGGGAIGHTIAFPKITARFFRVAFTTPPPAPNPFGNFDPEAFGGFRPPPPPSEFRIAELVLHTGARVNRYEEKAGFATLPDLSAFPTPPAPDDAVVRKSDVVEYIVEST